VGVERNISGPGDGLPSRFGTLVRELEGAGYATGLVGKWHLGRGPGMSPAAHGFDSFFGFHSWTLGYYTHRTPDGEPGLFRGDEVVDEPGYLTDLFSREAASFIRTQADRPFFLYLAYNTGLPPYQPPGLPEAAWDGGWDVNDASREDYVRMVEAMDGGIGRVLGTLRDEGLEQNTLVLFTYDHGGRHLVDSDPLFHGFATLWEGETRVPLIYAGRNASVAG
jgi:arylsulfatase A-like enzyme